MAAAAALDHDDADSDHGEAGSEYSDTLCSSLATGQPSVDAKLSAFTAPTAYRNSGAFVHATKFCNLLSILDQGLKTHDSDIFLIDEVRKDGRVPGLKDTPEILILIDEVKARSYNMEFQYSADSGVWTTKGIDGVIRPWFFQKVVDQRPSSRGNVLFQSKDDPIMHNVIKGPLQPQKLIHATYWENVPGILRNGIVPAKNPKGVIRRRMKDLLQGAENHVYAVDPRVMTANRTRSLSDADGKSPGTEYNVNGTIFGLDRAPDAFFTIDTEKAAALGYDLEMVQSSDRMGTVFVKGEVPPELLMNCEPNEPVELPDSLKAKIVDPKSFHQVPIIDLSKEDTVIVEQLRYACEVVGFFQVVGHGISEELLARHADFHRRFFELPKDVRQRLALDANSPVRGYFGPGGEDLDQVLGEKVDAAGGQKIKQQSRKDNKEALDMNGTPWSQPEGGYVAKIFGMPSRFPPEDVLPGLRQTMEEYNGEMFALAKRLLRLMAQLLGRDADFFDNHLTQPVATHRLLHYWPIKDYKTQIGVGEHTDYGLLTILRQDSTGGLQVLNAKDLKWVHALPMEGAFVVNIGDMLERWTDHKFKSTIHRVVNTSPADRFSAPYFIEPNMDSLIVLGGLLQDHSYEACVQAKTSEQILGSFYRASGQLKDYEASGSETGPASGGYVSTVLP